MKLSFKAGTASKDVNIFVNDSSVSTGAGLTGLVFNTGSLTAYYHRQGAATAVAITLVTKTVGTWASGGFVAVDATNLPGVYELGIPDAALAAGATWVIVMLKGASNMAPVVLEIELVAVDNQDVIKFGLTGVATPTNITAGTITTATNVTNVNGLATGVITATSIATDAITAAKIAADAIGASELAADAIAEIQAGLATPTNITAGTITTVTNLTNAPTVGDLTATMKTSVTTAATASTPTAAAVTGNIGGNVVGSVASVSAGVTLAIGAITAAVIATDAIDADAIAASAVTEIQSGLATLAGLFGYNLESTKTFAQAVLDIWATRVGDASANSAATPTSITYDSPDGTVQVTHTHTTTTRTLA